MRYLVRKTEFSMVASHEHDRPGASPDSEFTPPTRQQWIEAAVAGLESGDSNNASNNDALLQLRRTTLEGIPLEVLYDTAQASFSTSTKASPSGSWDNRLPVHIDDTTGATGANTKILQGLEGGISSIELHATDPAIIAPCLQGAQLNIATVSLRASQSYQSCTKSLVELAAEQGIEQQALHCNLNADPVGTWLQTGTAAEPMAEQLRQMASFASATSKQLPLATSVLVDATIHHNAGASTVEELHAAVATATLYLEAMLNENISINDACRQLVFQVAMDADVLLQIAKLRALQALWQHVVLQIESTVPTVEPATVIAETSQRFISLMEPWNNHLRNLAASTAAAMGGASTLIVHPHDALQRTDEQHNPVLGDRMARNIAIILERECGLRKVHDPMAGAYAIENLTEQLMQQTWQSLAGTDTGEGWLDELQSGRWQTRLAHTHKQRVTLMEQDKRIAIGVNRFVQTSNVDSPITVDLTSAVISKLDSDDKQAKAVLAPVRDSASFEQNLAQQTRRAANPETST